MSRVLTERLTTSTWRARTWSEKKASRGFGV